MTFKNQLRFPKIASCTLETQSNETVFNIHPSIGTEPLIIASNSYRGTGTIYDIGLAGSFTAVADASTSGTVTAVSGTAFGEVIMTDVAHGLVEGEFITTSTFADSNYNGLFEVLEIIDADNFRIHTLFTATGTGAWDSAKIDVTSTAHGLVFGDGVQLDTGDFSEGYNSGYKVLSSTANNFIVNQTFGATATGTWNTDSLNQLDGRMKVVGNSGLASSSESLFGTLNGNVNTTSITSNTYVAMDLTGMVAASLARFEATNLSAGVFTYTGLEDFTGALLGNFTISKSGSTETYRIALSIDGAAPVFASAFHYATEVTTTSKQFFGTFPVGNLTTGQTIQVMIAGVGTTNAVTISDGAMIGSSSFAG